MRGKHCAANTSSSKHKLQHIMLMRVMHIMLIHTIHNSRAQGSMLKCWDACRNSGTHGKMPMHGMHEMT
eukprot:1154358-Pelagomonas_calceolata.AAC.10